MQPACESSRPPIISFFPIQVVSCFLRVPDLWQEEVADIMRIRNECQRLLRLLLCHSQIGIGSIQIRERKTHQQFWFSPGWFQDVVSPRSLLTRGSQPLFVSLDCECLTSAAFGRIIKSIGAEDPQ